LLSSFFRKVWESLTAGLESIISIAAGLLPITIIIISVWATQFSFAASFPEILQSSVTTWLLGNGADAHITLSADIAASLGLSSESFRLGLAPLGIALITLFTARGAGKRFAYSENPWISFGVAVAVFEILVGALAFFAQSNTAYRPGWIQALIYPVVIFAIGVAWGILRGSKQFTTTRRIGGSLGVTLLSLLIASSIVLGASLVLAYAQIISLYEALQAGIFGGLVITLVQLLLLPNLLIWTLAWMSGAGFAIGDGSSISILGTTLGPIPALPIFGAIPTDPHWLFMLLILVVPLAGLLGATSLQLRLDRLPEALEGAIDWRNFRAKNYAIYYVSTVLVLAVLAVFASGGFGPGRAEVAGPPLGNFVVTVAIELLIGGAFVVYMDLVKRAPAIEMAER